MPLSGTLGVEAERLAKVSCKANQSCSDKNGQRPREMIISRVLRRLEVLRNLFKPRCRERNRAVEEKPPKKDLMAIITFG